MKKWYQVHYTVTGERKVCPGGIEDHVRCQPIPAESSAQAEQKVREMVQEYYWSPKSLTMSVVELPEGELTDLQKLIQVFDEFGIGYEVIKYEDEDKIRVCLYEGRAKIDGYHAFCSDYFFTLDGKFKEVYIYE